MARRLLAVARDQQEALALLRQPAPLAAVMRPQVDLVAGGPKDGHHLLEQVGAPGAHSRDVLEHDQRWRQLPGLDGEVDRPQREPVEELVLLALRHPLGQAPRVAAAGRAHHDHVGAPIAALGELLGRDLGEVEHLGVRSRQQLEVGDRDRVDVEGSDRLKPAPLLASSSEDPEGL